MVLRHQILSFPFAPKQLALVVASFLTLNCSGGSQQIIPGAESKSKDESAGTKSDDTPDDSAPVSGAYLTCVVPMPKAGDTEIFAGCQMRDKNNKHVNLKNNNKSRWSYTPPKTAPVKPSITVFDLSHSKKSRYFDAVFRMKLPKGAATASTMTGLRLAPLNAGLNTDRNNAGNFFLHSAPVLMPKTVLLSQVKKSLGLADGEVAPPATFNGLNNITLQGGARAIDPQVVQDVSKSPNNFNVVEVKDGASGPQFELPPDAPAGQKTVDGDVDFTAENAQSTNEVTVQEDNGQSPDTIASNGNEGNTDFNQDNFPAVQTPATVTEDPNADPFQESALSSGQPVGDPAAVPDL